MEADRKLAELQTALSSEVKKLLQNERQKLSSLGQQLPAVIDRRLIVENNLLSRFMPLLRQNIAQRISGERQRARPAGRNDTVIISSTHIETRLLTDIERGKSRPLGNRTEKRRPYRYFFR